jgi:hypothetical protein
MVMVSSCPRIGERGRDGLGRQRRIGGRREEQDVDSSKPARRARDRSLCGDPLGGTSSEEAEGERAVGRWPMDADDAHVPDDVRLPVQYGS